MIKKIVLLLIFYPLNLSVLQGCGGCFKDYYFKGKVTDVGGNPIEGAEAAFASSELGVSDQYSIVTDANGEYFLSSLQTRTNYATRYLQFEKSGYQDIQTEPFTKSEAGPDVCGSVTLVRDVVMTP